MQYISLAGVYLCIRGLTLNQEEAAAPGHAAALRWGGGRGCVRWVNPTAAVWGVGGLGERGKHTISRYVSIYKRRRQRPATRQP